MEKQRGRYQLGRSTPKWQSSMWISYLCSIFCRIGLPPQTDFRAFGRRRSAFGCRIDFWRGAHGTFVLCPSHIGNVPRITLTLHGLYCTRAGAEAFPAPPMRRGVNDSLHPSGLIVNCRVHHCGVRAHNRLILSNFCPKNFGWAIALKQVIPGTPGEEEQECCIHSHGGQR